MLSTMVSNLIFFILLPNYGLTFNADTNATIEDPCQLPVEKGICMQNLMRFYYDKAADECRRFSYSGCGGNGNRFFRRVQCRQRCVKDLSRRYNFAEQPLTNRPIPPVVDEILRRRQERTEDTTLPIPTTKTTPPFQSNFAEKTPVIKTSCPICDPLYGKCVDGRCECVRGYQKKGRICVDINECQVPGVCPAHATCINTAGGFRCECDGNKCDAAADICDNEFDRHLLSDCGQPQKARYFFNKDTTSCEEFSHAGCQTKSLNVFPDKSVCEAICDVKVKQHYQNITEFAQTSTNSDTDKDVAASRLTYLNILSHKPTSLPSTSETAAKENEERSNEANTYASHAVVTVTTEADIVRSNTALADPKASTVSDSTCHQTFDEVLRLECLHAAWMERFYWNSEKTECEPFWYDISCKEEDRKGKNFFETLAECQKTCHEKEAQTSLDSTKLPDQTEPPTTESLENILQRSAFTTSSPPPPKANGIEISSPFASEPISEDNQQSDVGIERTVVTPIPPLKEQLIDNCLVPLAEKLEEDCLGDKWEIKWYFNTERKSCKRFWYGGCETESGNFFNDVQSCKETCGHLYAVDDNFTSLQSHLSPYIITSTTTTKDSDTQSNTVASEQLDVTASTSTTSTSTTATTTTTASTTTAEEVTQEAEFPLKSTVATEPQPSIEQSHEDTHEQETHVEDEQTTHETAIILETDPCLHPFDAKFEEDCALDNWEPRSYYDQVKKDCRRFWFGGCPSVSKNLFQDQKACRSACYHLIPKSETQGPPSADGSNNTMPQCTSCFDDDLTKLTDVELSSSTLAPALSINLQGSETVDSVAHILVNESSKEYTLALLGTSQSSNSRNKTTTSVYSKRLYVSAVENGTMMTTISSLAHFMKDASSEQSNRPIGELSASAESASSLPSSVAPAPTLAWKNFPFYSPAARAKELDYSTTLRSTTFVSSESKSPSENISTVKDIHNHTAFDKSTGTTKYELLHHSSTAAPSDAVRSKTTMSILGVRATLTTTRPEGSTLPNVTDVATSVVDSEVSSDKKDVQAFKMDMERRLAEAHADEGHLKSIAYSRRFHTTITVAEECLDAFDKNLTKSCMYESEWKNRYYYDQDTRSCRMFWWDGCHSTSRNNFADSEICEWKCMGRHPDREGRACLDPFDTSYLGDCRHGEFVNRYYFDLSKKKCVSFHWGGCRSESLNLFTEMGDCRDTCESPPRQLAQACMQPFDHSYRDSCSTDGRFLQYYFFDHVTHTCRMFWYGNCRRTSENIFPSLETCQWICERHRDERAPTQCQDKFDQKYTESCGHGAWQEKWYFNHELGSCVSFWFDQCVSSSQNIFPDRETCANLCEHQGFDIAIRLPDPESSFRCLERKAIGDCKETYPAFYYDRKTKKCLPFVYSGCEGTGNRFLSLQSCERTCSEFSDLSGQEMDCYEPVDVGYGRNDPKCVEHASFRFFYDRDYESCVSFWYLGCGGNSNNFYSYDICQRTCQPRRRRLPRLTFEDNSQSACFRMPADPGRCVGNSTTPVQRYTYKKGKCAVFSYSGCGGSSNRFASLRECEKTCLGRKPSVNPRKCSLDADVGQCNHLEYKWHFDNRKGGCAQFLYGGCGGNLNRFDTFEECQKECEPSGIDPCMEPLDRGKWCEAMSNRYYFNKRHRECKGFHYTGCGKSSNNFLTLEECEARCLRKGRRTLDDDNGLEVVGNDVTVIVDFKTHVKVKRAEEETLTTKKPTSSKKQKKKGYAHKKPAEKSKVIKHIDLSLNNISYAKSAPEWLDYTSCVGYRYNVSGDYTILKAHLCVMERDHECMTEIRESTDGDELCDVFRPFLRGVHLYSFMFDLKQAPVAYTPGVPKRYPKKDEIRASILILKPNQCHDIC